MFEEWTRIKDAEGYEISNFGRVRNSKTRRILKPELNRPNGYERVKLHGRYRYIHRLMAETFCADGLEYGDIVKHRSHNKQNNHAYNLKIVRGNERFNLMDRV